MSSIHSTNHPTTPWLARSIMACCVISALAIFILALQRDTTLLGDPYYEDKILAPARAFLPWLLTLTTIFLSGIMGIMVRLKK